MEAPLPATPGLEFAFLIRAEIGDALNAGPSPAGERLHIPISGGKVEGPLLNGRIVPGGSDWPLIRYDGASQISARYTIVADDGAPIYVRNDGLRVSSPEVLARLRAGEAVDPADYYFRSTPCFEAPIGPHDWLNQSVFVASLGRTEAGVLISVYRVT